MMIVTTQILPLPNEDFGMTKDEMRIFEALFKGVSTQIWATNH